MDMTAPFVTKYRKKTNNLSGLIIKYLIWTEFQNRFFEYKKI